MLFVVHACLLLSYPQSQCLGAVPMLFSLSSCMQNKSKNFHNA